MPDMINARAKQLGKFRNAAISVACSAAMVIGMCPAVAMAATTADDNSQALSQMEPLAAIAYNAGWGSGFLIQPGKTFTVTLNVKSATTDAVSCAQITTSFDSSKITLNKVEGASNIDYSSADNQVLTTFYGNSTSSVTLKYTFTANANASGDANIAFVKGFAGTTGQLYEYEISCPETQSGATITNGFPDVTGDWYYDSVLRAASSGLVSGYNNGNYGPNDTLTRAQVVTMLWNYYQPDEAKAYDQTTAKNETKMPDVADGQYYTGAANWAVANGVISGTAEGNFEPNTNITRDQMCAIFANAAKTFAGATIEGADKTKFNSMPDNGQVETYAVDSVAWCLNNGVISGRDNTYIAPLGNVTRAESAAILINSIDHNLLK